MINLNQNYFNLKNNYIFCEVSNKIHQYKLDNPEKKIISLSIGDVSRPLGKGVTKSMILALEDQSLVKRFKGYPPEEGYEFLRTAISKYYSKRKVDISADEIFISNGACCDVCNILDILGNNTAIIQNPTYPAYYDSNILNGNNVILLNANQENNYCISPNNLKEQSYIIYICSPNNPTGSTLNKKQLTNWVDFAIKTKSLIIFDCAYESFIQDTSPHFIYEIKNAKKCAIEIASFSKMAGFTGIRASWTVVPKQLIYEDKSLKDMWQRRQSTRFNGIPYFIQKGAEYALSDVGIKENKKNIKYYQQNAKLIIKFCKKFKLEYTGGVNAPYVWIKCPNNLSSWQMFDKLLYECQVACIPGCGFGTCGEGYIRLSCFASKSDTLQAIKKMSESGIFNKLS